KIRMREARFGDRRGRYAILVEACASAPVVLFRSTARCEIVAILFLRRTRTEIGCALEFDPGQDTRTRRQPELGGPPESRCPYFFLRCMSRGFHSRHPQGHRESEGHPPEFNQARCRTRM